MMSASPTIGVRSTATTKSSPSIIDRFVGPAGKKRLKDALCNQELIAGDKSIASQIAAKANPKRFSTGYDIITQGNPDNELFFVLSGSVSVRVNGREIATRSAGQHIGEMAMIDTTAVRSATVRALEPVVAALIAEKDFTRIADREPVLWRRLAVTTACRLRERNKFHSTPRSEPAVFIGSSSEGLGIAESIHKSLLKRRCVPKLWSEGVFECSYTAIETLIQIAKNIDCAIIVLSPDDVTNSRKKAAQAPRDNIVFELGLFMGAIGRERTFIVAPRGIALKIPTDLLGVTQLKYDNRRNFLSSSLKPLIKEIDRLIANRGPI